ncbi:MAG: SDR family NAD(P)-dependent oxidoreductase [Clostridiales bacterium]|nr:SDR family NAD(P)-dependent oxidoreductase [Clostridiales bacterium]
MTDFAGKIAFITGGASGAGFGMAQVFSEAGMKVVIADVRRDHIEEAMDYFRQTEAEVHAIELDVTDREGFAAAADEVERVFGSAPDLLILNAGVNVGGPVESSTYEDFDWIIGVCFGGVINGMMTFVPRMIKAGKGGHIAATASYGAFGAYPFVAPYSAAKAATLNLMESYYLALERYGIGVSVLTPANINSNIYDAALKTRPEKYKNTGYSVSEEGQLRMASFNRKGLEPRDLAMRLKKGIEDGIFLIVPYEHGGRMVELAMDRFKHYTSVEGMKYLKEKAKQPPTEEEIALMNERENFEVSKIKR